MRLNQIVTGCARVRTVATTHSLLFSDVNANPGRLLGANVHSMRTKVGYDCETRNVIGCEQSRKATNFGTLDSHPNYLLRLMSHVVCLIITLAKGGSF